MRRILLIAVLAAAACESPTATVPDLNVALMTADCSEKLHFLAERAVQDHPNDILGLLVRTTHPPTADDLADLEATGLAVGTVVDDILTGRILGQDVCDMAALPVVQYIELGGVRPGAITTM